MESMNSNLKNVGWARSAWLELFTAAITILLIATVGVAHADAVDGSRGPITSLAYDARSGSLLKSDGDALYRSVDEGQNWNAIALPSSVEGHIAAVATSADGSAIYLAGSGFGILVSKDDGADWAALNQGLPSTKVTAFAAHATLPRTLYAYLPKTGIYRSQDAGKSWKLMDRGPEGIRQIIHTNMKGSMQTGWLYAATARGVQVSMDCFCLWRDAGGLDGKIDTLAYDPRQPEHLFAASKKGLFRSTNGGQEWESATSPEIAVTALTMTPSGLYAATTAGSAVPQPRWRPIVGARR